MTTARSTVAVDLDESWSSLTGVHGGHVASLAVDAARAVVGDRAIRTISTNFLRPVTPGRGSFCVERLHDGRSLSHVTATLWQSEQPVAVSQITAADAVGGAVWDTSGDVTSGHLTSGHLAIAPIELCVPVAPPNGIRHFEHAEALLDPANLPFTHGELARVAGYVRPIDAGATVGSPIDAAWLAMALDWFPPASFSRVDPPTGGISINYTVHVHHTIGALPRGEWLRGVFQADISTGGIALEKGSIADASGRLLAESFHTRWMAARRLPPAP